MAMAVKTGTLACSFIFAALLSVALSACKQGQSNPVSTGGVSTSTTAGAPPTIAGTPSTSGSGTSNALVAPTYAAARLLVGVHSGDRLQVLGRTSLSDGGQGLFTWVPGGTTTVDEGYVLQATGGTWQRVDPSPTTGETLLNAVWYNIKPTNADTVNDTGFAKLKAQMQTSATTTWRVFFPPGAYTYTNNRWLFGVQKVIIDAYDVSFQNTNTGGVPANQTAFLLNDMFSDWGDADWPGTGVYANGYLFNTAAAGAFSITTTTAADAGNFTPGMRAILYGYDQQGAGYPPNARYFEYKVVLTATAGTGGITFANQLVNSYDSSWWDTANQLGTGKSVGAPRILSLDRPNYKIAKLIWIKGAKFIPSFTSDNLQTPAELVIYEDVTANNVVAALSGVVVLRHSTFRGYGIYPDKIVDKLFIEDSTIDGNPNVDGLAISDGDGINSVSLIRSKFFGALAMSPRNLLIDNCEFIPPSTGHYPMSGDFTPFPIRAVTIRNTRVYNTGSVFNGWSNIASPGNSLTVGSVSGTDILLTFSMAVAQSIEYGMTLTNTVTGNTGVITAIYASGANLRIAGTWSAPSPGDVFDYYDVMLASDGGGNVIVGPQVPFWRGPPGP
jgi:hypothetical protein